jgi:hypothetical protein
MILTWRAGKLLLAEGGKTQTLTNTALAESGLAPTELEAYLSPEKNLLVIFHNRPQDGESEFLAALPLAVEPGSEPKAQRGQ